jgi:hypothetical protein
LQYANKRTACPAPLSLLHLSKLITPISDHNLFYPSEVFYSSSYSLSLRNKQSNQPTPFTYVLHNIVRVIKSRMRWAGHVVRMGEDKVVYRVSVGKPEAKRPLGRPRCRWEDNIGMDLQEVGCGGMDWIGLAQDRDMWWGILHAVMNLRVQ